MLGHGFSQPFTFTGREYDPESGLYYYRARYYDASTGRFISKDPIGFEGGDTNLYAYAGNNPVNFVDPTGLSYHGPLSCPAKQKLVIAIEAWAYSKLRMGISTVLGALFGRPVFTIPPSPIPNWTLDADDVYGMCVPECYIKIGEEWTPEWTKSPIGFIDYKYRNHNIFYGPSPNDPCCK